MIIRSVRGGRMWQRFFRSGDMTRVRQRRGLSSLAQRKYEGADARHGVHRKCYIVTSHGLHQCVSAEAECHVTDGRAKEPLETTGRDQT